MQVFAIVCIVSKGDLSFGANTRRGVLNGLYVVFVSPTSITCLYMDKILNVRKY